MTIVKKAFEKALEDAKNPDINNMAYGRAQECFAVSVVVQTLASIGVPINEAVHVAFKHRGASKKRLTACLLELRIPEQGQYYIDGSYYKIDHKSTVFIWISEEWKVSTRSVENVMNSRADKRGRKRMFMESLEAA